MIGYLSERDWGISSAITGKYWQLLTTNGVLACEYSGLGANERRLYSQAN